MPKTRKKQAWDIGENEGLFWFEYGWIVFEKVNCYSVLALLLFLANFCFVSYNNNDANHLCNLPNEI